MTTGGVIGVNASGMTTVAIVTAGPKSNARNKLPVA